MSPLDTTQLSGVKDFSQEFLKGYHRNSKKIVAFHLHEYILKNKDLSSFLSYSLCRYCSISVMTKRISNMYYLWKWYANILTALDDISQDRTVISNIQLYQIVHKTLSQTTLQLVLSTATSYNKDVCSFMLHGHFRAGTKPSCPTKSQTHEYSKGR